MLRRGLRVFIEEWDKVHYCLDFLEFLGGQGQLEFVFKVEDEVYCAETVDVEVFEGGGFGDWLGLYFGEGFDYLEDSGFDVFEPWVNTAI